MQKLAASLLLVVLVGCRPGSPVTIEDRPLAERMEDRRAGQVQQVVEEFELSEPTPDAPEELALTEEAPVVSFDEPIVVAIVGSPLGVKLRNGPGPGYGDLLVIPENATLRTTGNVTGEWAQVRYGDFEGWVPVRVLEPAASETGDTIPIGDESGAEAGTSYVVAGAEVGVNIRAEPDSSSALVSGAPVGSTVVSTGRTEGIWIEVEFNGVTGWAYGSYLQPAPDGSAD